MQGLRSSWQWHERKRTTKGPEVRVGPLSASAVHMAASVKSMIEDRSTDVAARVITQRQELRPRRAAVDAATEDFWLEDIHSAETEKVRTCNLPYCSLLFWRARTQTLGIIYPSADRTTYSVSITCHMYTTISPPQHIHPPPHPPTRTYIQDQPTSRWIAASLNRRSDFFKEQV